MDLKTVVVVIALHLISSGVLLALIGRQLRGSGFGQWALGTFAFGSCYLGRLASGLANTDAFSLPLDLAMVLAVLLLLSGLRIYLGQSGVPRNVYAAVALAYAAAYVAVLQVAGETGRHAALSLVLGALYGAIALTAQAGIARQSALHRVPLIVCATMMGGLALLTLGRSALIATEGAPAVYGGAFAQLYYGYSSVVGLLLALDMLWLAFVRLNGRLAELATHDALTGTLNRNGLQELLARHFAARVPRPLVLLQVDLDHFKQINDHHGHAAGDAVLAGAADAMRAVLRGDDFVARTGGEEFVVGCATADLAVATSLAERLRGSVDAMRIDFGGRTVLTCSASIGVSPSIATYAEWEAAIRDADRALYAAKAAGRNRVEVATIAGPGDSAAASSFEPAFRSTLP